jgi:hypothetical protein
LDSGKAVVHRLLQVRVESVTGIMYAPQQKAGEYSVRDVTNPALHPPNPNPGVGGTDFTPIGAAEI